MRRLEACQSPVWDTVLSMTALEDAGLAADHEALTRAAHWILDEEIKQPGDWQVRRPHTAPGGWAFEFENDNYADTDDTAEVDPRAAPARPQGADAGEPRRDPPRPALAGRHAVQGRRLGRVRRRQHPRADQQAAVLRLRRGHRPAERGRHRAHRRGVRGRGPGRGDRLPAGRDLAAEEPGTGRLLVRPLGRELPLRHRRGRPRARSPPASSRASRRSARRSPGSSRCRTTTAAGARTCAPTTTQAEWSGRGASTASQTAWALLALLAAGERDGKATERGLRWLAQTQRADGTWDEPYFTGTGFPRDFYLNYHLYRLAFPVSALGQIREGYFA